MHSIWRSSLIGALLLFGSGPVTHGAVVDLGVVKAGEIYPLWFFFGPPRSSDSVMLTLMEPARIDLFNAYSVMDVTYSKASGDLAFSDLSELTIYGQAGRHTFDLSTAPLPQHALYVAGKPYYYYAVGLEVSPVPVPAGLALLATSLAGMALAGAIKSARALRAGRPSA